MPLIPLVPLDPAQLHGAEAGFRALGGLDTATCPAGFAPAAESLRITSYPTPFALEQATRSLTRQDQRSHPLVKGSTALIHAIFGGLYHVDWIAPSELEVGASAPAAAGAKVGGPRPTGLRTALEVFLGDRKRIGLIRSPELGLVGLVMSDGLVVLGANRITNVDDIVKSIRTHDRLRPTVAYLIRQSLAQLESLDDTDESAGTKAQLRLALEGAGPPAESVDLVEDIRAIGPFYAHRNEAGTRLTSHFFWLVRAPGFTLRFARCLALPPGDVTRQRLSLIFRASPLATVRACSGELGDGLADVVPDTLPSGVPDVELLAKSAQTDRYRSHLEATRVRLGGTLTDALVNAPHRLSDVARAFAAYAPEAIGEAAHRRLSPAFRDAFVAAGREPRLSRTAVQALIAVRKAFALVSKTPDEPDIVYIEEADGIVVGDLSRLGLALLAAFAPLSSDRPAVAVVRGATGPTFFDLDGDPLIDPGSDFPLEVSALIARGPEDVDAKAWCRRVATLQRFLSSYSASARVSDGLAGLADAAAQAIVGRLLDRAGKPRELVFGVVAGTVGTPETDRTLDLLSRGKLSILRDVYGR
jgi:hypothetical protein